MDQEISPYALGSADVVPPEHRMFLHCENSCYYVYGCNTAYQATADFKKVASATIRFPFFASALSWHFFTAVKFESCVFGVINRSLFVFSEFLAQKICDTPVYRGYNPLVELGDKLIFYGQDEVFEFNARSMQFLEVELPRITTEFCFEQYYFDDLNQKVVDFLSAREFVCKELLFGHGHLALCEQGRSSNGPKYVLVDLLEGKQYCIDEELVNSKEIVFSFHAYQNCIVLEQAGLFTDFDDQFWYEQEDALLGEQLFSFNGWRTHFAVCNLHLVERLEDYINKICLYKRRIGYPEEVAPYRKTQMRELTRMRSEAIDIMRLEIFRTE